MFESFILGMVQGIAEWLPVSSEAMIIVVKNNFFPGGISFSEIISYAIFLHLGTLFSALIYFRKKILKIVKSFFRYSVLKREEQSEIRFIVIATLVSGVVGILLLALVAKYESFFSQTSLVNIIVALFLGFTAFLLYLSESKIQHTNSNKFLTFKQTIVTGIFQGTSALPGISRSGSTIAAMGLVGIEKKRALELSFILSIPIVLGANIFLNLDTFLTFSISHLIALGSACVFGLITIDMLLRLVERIRFSVFVAIFAVMLGIFGVMHYFSWV